VYVSKAAVDVLRAGPAKLCRVVVTRRSGVETFAMLPEEVADFERGMVHNEGDDRIEHWVVNEPQAASVEVE
jgi:hypothetical protein